MPRVSRCSLSSNYFHVIVQGINKNFIFNSCYDKKKYLSLISNIAPQENVIILSYCIMSNHTHCLIYSDNTKSLSKFMQRVNTSYSRYFNQKYKRVGYVFRDRFVSQPILSKNHLFNCIVYIHMNPIKANLAKNLKDYKYSSYNLFLKKIIDEKVIKLLFDSADYLDFFNQVHSKPVISYDFFDVQELKNTNQVIKDFMKKCNSNMDDIRKNPIFIKKLGFQLINDCNLSKREIANILNINREKIRLLLK